MQKLRHVKSIKKMPRNILSAIERLNALRNGLAHAFFPENLRKSKPKWKGKDIFSLEGVKALGEDFDDVVEFFFGV